MSVAYGKPEQYAILEKVRQIFRKRGGGICTFRSLSRAFRIMDTNRDKRLTFDELKTGLCDMGARSYLGQHEWPKLFSIFDHDGSGSIDQAEFLLAVRGTLSAARRVLVDHAFSLMDKSCTGMINKDDIESRFRGHDATLMMRALGDRNSDGFITPDEWRDYYASISANFDTDAGFNLMMRNAWHISGGVGAESNTTNKRVLVTRLDGSQTVEAIEEDLGLDHRQPRSDGRAQEAGHLGCGRLQRRWCAYGVILVGHADAARGGCEHPGQGLAAAGRGDGAHAAAHSGRGVRAGGPPHEPRVGVAAWESSRVAAAARQRRCWLDVRTARLPRGTHERPYAQRASGTTSLGLDASTAQAGQRWARATAAAAAAAAVRGVVAAAATIAAAVSAAAAAAAAAATAAAVGTAA